MDSLPSTSKLSNGGGGKLNKSSSSSLKPNKTKTGGSGNSSKKSGTNNTSTGEFNDTHLIKQQSSLPPGTQQGMSHHMHPPLPPQTLLALPPTNQDFSREMNNSGFYQSAAYFGSGNGASNSSHQAMSTSSAYSSNDLLNTASYFMNLNHPHAHQDFLFNGTGGSAAVGSTSNHHLNPFKQHNSLPSQSLAGFNPNQNTYINLNNSNAANQT